ncbi:MAG: flagellar biosynthesis protein [Oscillibacter sp.]|nr:flagellar biosynthesis protein [Oscillibacter sp.]
MGIQPASGTADSPIVQEVSVSGVTGAGTAESSAGTAEPGAARQTVSFSKHAMARVEARGIQLTDTLLDKLADSVEKAQEKGAKNILAFDATQAFIINIPYNRVVTAISQEEMRENIFTNIDGAVLL